MGFPSLRLLLSDRRLNRSFPFWRSLVAFAAGSLTVLAFAPFSLHYLAIPATSLLFLLWLNGSPTQAFREGWLYGAGLMGVGVFWMHISIDQFGNVGTLLAVLITLLFAAAMALFYGAVGWLAVRFDDAATEPVARLLSFSLLWVLFEWLRGWVLGGFPWLALGYSQIDSVVAGWAPLLGVYGVSLAITLSVAAVLGIILSGVVYRRLLLTALLAVIWGGGYLLSELVEWTQAAGEPISVSIVQGNIAQEEKWRPENLQPTLDLYTDMTRKNWDSDLIIWPETAVPAFVAQVEKWFLRPMELEAKANRSTLLLGIADRKPDGKYYNAMLALGTERAVYHKRHLVPFGEFMPLKSILRPLIDWLQIPMSDFSPGAQRKPLLVLAGYAAGISICYEDAFGAEVMEALPEAAFLVNASNDAWFGDSLAMPQHLEIARMRALESGRYLLRSTNTGISAIVAPDGGIVAASPAFKRDLLTGSITPLQGMTPYARWGNWTIVSFAIIGLVVLAVMRRRVRRLVGHADSSVTLSRSTSFIGKARGRRASPLSLAPGPLKAPGARQPVGE